MEIFPVTCLCRGRVIHKDRPGAYTVYVLAVSRNQAGLLARKCLWSKKGLQGIVRVKKSDMSDEEAAKEFS